MEEFRGSVSRGCHHGQVSGEAVARTSSSWKAMKFIHVVRAMSPAVKKCIEFGIAQCFSNSLSLWPPKIIKTKYHVSRLKKGITCH